METNLEELLEQRQRQVAALLLSHSAKPTEDTTEDETEAH